jgi:parallel beta-helix repeat protein
MHIFLGLLVVALIGLFISPSLDYRQTNTAGKAAMTKLPAQKRILGETGLPMLTAQEKVDATNELLGSKGAAWRTGVNKFTDMPNEERKKYLGARPQENPVKAQVFQPQLPRDEIPDLFDWRDQHGQNYITPVKAQAMCGSCWAFGVIATIEGAAQAQYNNPQLGIDLSEQQPVSCCTDCGAGCISGDMGYTMEYVKDVGITSEACFPYTHCDAECRGTCSDYTCTTCDERCPDWQETAWTIDDYQVIPPTEDVETVKDALISYGPIVTAFTVYDDFWGYESGIYTHTYGDDVGGHVVTIVGYGVQDSLEYWICKNSWSDGWGEDGYFRIGVHEAGIDTSAKYVAVRPHQANGQSITTLCTDRDADMHCTWGLGEKPAVCSWTDISGCQLNQWYRWEGDLNGAVTITDNPQYVLNGGLGLQLLDRSTSQSFAVMQLLEYPPQEELGLYVHYKQILGPDNTLHLFIKYYDQDYAMISSVNLPIPMVMDGAFHERSISAVPPTATRYAMVMAFIPGDKRAEVALDDFRFIPSSKPYDNLISNPGFEEDSLAGCPQTCAGNNEADCDDSDPAIVQGCGALPYTPGVVRVESSPVADVFVRSLEDGLFKKIGETPTDLELEPGDRELKIDKNGFIVQYRHVLVIPGGNEIVSVNLEPGLECGDTITQDTVLDQDLLGCCTEDYCAALIVDGPDIHLDCNHHIIQGTGQGVGIDLHRRSGVEVKNCVIKGFWLGMTSLNNDWIHDNIFSENIEAMYIGGSSQNTVEHNTITNNRIGIMVMQSDRNELSFNRICGNNDVDLGCVVIGEHNAGQGNAIDIIDGECPGIGHTPCAQGNSPVFKKSQNYAIRGLE